MTWVQAASDGTPLRNDEGLYVRAEQPQPDSFAIPPVHPRARRTDTGVRDEFVVHFTGRDQVGKPNQKLPTGLAGVDPVVRLRTILSAQLLLAGRPFGRRGDKPAVCFCEGDHDARSKLLAEGRYSPHGLAFHRAAVDKWGARPVTYADSDLAYLLHMALFALSQNDEMLETHGFSQEQIDVAKALIVRDWPGAVEPKEYFDEHGLDYTILNPHEWGHEHEMRLAFTAGNLYVPVLYWFYKPTDVAHILLPGDEDARRLATNLAVSGGWPLDLPVYFYDAASGTYDTGNPLKAWVDWGGMHYQT